MDDRTANWLRSARYDVKTAQHMLEAGRYIYTVFMCHLAIEKALKARFEFLTGTTPPKTHDLEQLLSLSQLEPDPEKEVFLAELSNLSVVMRYPQDFGALKKSVTKKRAQATLVCTKEMFRWIQKSLKS